MNAGTYPPRMNMSTCVIRLLMHGGHHRHHERHHHATQPQITKQRIISQTGPSCRPRRCGGAGISCSVTTDSIDLDHVRDVTLIRPCCCVLCCPCCDVGEMRIFGSDASTKRAGQGDSFIVPYIEHSKDVHDRLTEFLTKGQYPGFRLGGGAPPEVEVQR